MDASGLILREDSFPDGYHSPFGKVGRERIPDHDAPPLVAGPTASGGAPKVQTGEMGNTIDRGDR